MKKKDSKYQIFLTVVLIVATLGIALLIGIWGYKRYEEYDLLASAEQAVEEFDDQFENKDIKEIIEEQVDTNNIEQEDISYASTDTQQKLSNNSKKTTNSTNSTKKTSSSSSKTVKKKLYKGYVMTGYIEIPRTKVKLPLLESVSPGALDKSVAVLMTDGLNQPGNTTIVGHNYRNRTLFSRNGELEVGDLIYITDETGNKVQYTIYETYLTSPDDSEYMTRNTEGETEISLSTCTNDNSQRIIILARADTI